METPVKRAANYDILRIVAMCFVISVHSLGVTPDMGGDFLHSWYPCIANALFISANAIFFIMSGHFNIRQIKDDDFPKYYYKKLRNILLPALVVFLLHTAYETFPTCNISDFIKLYIRNVLGVLAHTEYWFVFQLFGFLLAAPFIYRALNGLGKKGTVAFISLGFLFNFARFLGANLEVEFRWDYILTPFAFTFCLGFWLTRWLDSPKARRNIFIMGGTSFLIALYLARHGWTSELNDVAPFYTLYSLAICVVVLRATKRIEENAVISAIARHSYSAYLVHVMVVYPLADHIVPILRHSDPIAISIAIAVASIILSVTLAFFIDCTAVRALKLLADRIQVNCARRFKPETSGSK